MSKRKAQSFINLETLAGGTFAEKLTEALAQVTENIQNPNTKATKKRQINVALKFAPNKTRKLVSVQIAITTKLAATEAIDTQMIMEVNARTGQLEITEYDGQIRGQMSFPDIIQTEEKAELAPNNDGTAAGDLESGEDFDPTTGEIFDKAELSDIPNRKKITFIV